MLNQTIRSRSRLIGLAILTTIATTILLIYAAGSNAAVFSFFADKQAVTEDSSPIPEFQNAEAACATVTAGMTNWWPADGNSRDVRGPSFENAELFNGAGYTTGKVSQAFNFDGTDDYASVPASANWAFGTADFTVGFWVRSNTNDDRRPLVNNRRNILPGNPSMWAIEIYNVPNRVEFHSGTTILLTATSRLTNSSWNHVVVTRTGTTLNMYINGAPAGSGTSIDNYSEVNDLQIGRDLLPMVVGDLGKTLNGSIDELMIFNRSISASEVSAIFNAGDAGVCPSCTPPLDGTVSWWRGEGDPADVYGLNDGILQNGASFAGGKVGRGFRFGVPGQHVEIPDSPSLRPVNGLTLDGWFRFDTANPQAALISKPYLTGLSNAYVVWMQGGALNASVAGAYLSYPFNPVAGQWYHIAYTYDESTTLHRLYIDGNIVASVVSNADPTYDSSSLLIGIDKDNNTPVLQLVGMADEVGISGRAMTPVEIQSMFNAGSAGMCVETCAPPPNGMVGWWSADGNSFDIVNGNHGSLVNGVTYGAGRVDRAFGFNPASQQFVSIPQADQLLSNSAGAITVWINPASQGSFKIVAAFGSSVPGEVVGLALNGNVRIYHQTDTFDWQTGVPVSANEWTFLAYTWDGTTERLYKNGSLAESRPRNFNYVPGYSRIGYGFINDASLFFGGLVDELSIFNRTLNAAQISAIYDAGGSGVCRTCTQPPNGLISWWPGDGNATDLISSYNGVLKNGATFAPGMVSQAFRFDGVDDHVLALNTTNINGGTEVTYDAWVYPTAVPAVGEYFGILGVGDSTNPTWTTQQCRVLYWRTADAPSGTARFYIDCGLDNNENYAGRYSAGFYPINTWSFVAGVFNNGTLEIYVNGVLDNGALTGTGGAAVNTNPLRYAWIGAHVRNSDASLYVPFKGKIDEPEIFSRALTASEIIAIYNAGNAGKCRPGLGRAYVPNSDDGTVSVIDIGTNFVSETITAPQQFGFVTIKNDGSKAYVSGAALSKVTVIDTATNAVLTDFTLPGATHGLAVDVTGTKLYVAQESGNSLWVLNADTGALLATVPIGANPYGVAASPDGSRVYTANYSNGSVSMIRTSDLSVETFPTGSVPYGIAVSPDSSKVFVSNFGSNTVSVIDTATNNITSTINFPGPTGVAVNKAGTRVYVGSQSTNNVLAINTADNSTNSIPVGAPTEGISVSPDGSRILAAARTGNAVFSINAPTNNVTLIPVGSAPYSLGLFIAQGYTAAPAPAPDSCDPKPAGITHWWRGHGNALDTQKGTHAMLVNHTTFAPGIVGKAFSFDGVDDFASAPAFDMGANWTVEGWINPAGCSDNLHCPMFARSDTNFDGLILAYLGAGHLQNNEFALSIGNGGAWQVTLGSTSKYSIGSWYHVAATKSGDTYRLYVNGVQRAEQTVAGVSNQYQSRDLRLGRWSNGASAYLNGKIDEVALYKRALSATEIKAIHDVAGYGKCTAGMTNTDLDGDMSTDLTVFRPAGATGTEWWTLRSSTGGNWAAQFGDQTDRIVAEDFTGDGRTDVAIFRPSNSNWYILRSEDYSYYSFPFGTTGDIAVPADYDGDGLADPAVYRPSTGVWYIARSTGGLGQERFGFPTDKPVPADYDGDGRIDIAIYRPSNGQWWLNRTTEGLIVHTFGNDTDYNVPGDFTGDGKADVAIFRPSDNNWYVLRSEDYTYYSFPFGAAGDIPAAGDFDGDARFDAVVFRPSDGKWYLKRSTAGITVIPFGAPGDIPVPGAFIR